MYKNILIYNMDNKVVKIVTKDIVILSEYISLLLNDNIKFSLKIKGGE